MMLNAHHILYNLGVSCNIVCLISYIYTKLAFTLNFALRKDETELGYLDGKVVLSHVSSACCECPTHLR